jgi:hypothetical protein
MGSIIGRGRYARATYPERANSSGNVESILPFEAIFGDGADGALTTAPGVTTSLGGNYTSFTLAAGTTLKPPAGRNLIVIRATQQIVLEGKIDVSGVTAFATSGGVWYGSDPVAFGGGGGGGGGSMSSPAFFPGNNFNNAGGGPSLGFTPAMFGSGGNNGMPGDGPPTPTAGGNGDPATPSSPGTADPTFAQQIALALAPVIFSGGSPGFNGAQGSPGAQGAFGSGGNGGSPGNGGNGGSGGAGGGCIFLIAPSIVFGAACELHADGTAGAAGATGSPGGNAPGGSNGGGGGAGGGGGGGGGGCGGLIIARAGAFSGPGPLAATVTGGAGGADGAGASGGTGDGTGKSGGNGGNGAKGPTGTTGLVIFSPI